ncbi:MAG TPA: type I glyceraldehyde-3-phosphate dehydrogenase [Methanoculleus sp.]|jgi:glyceraldehyde-3-phosphate dehydrogenase type I|uniref:type I glyceraldehyde-3-phosphate dehydrogenase n=1 Tax=Methanoculleus sp. TaxID=90427 RepID=UPI002BB12F36|nr:type I glyceraldehyde-3-phosphate dehydrogenase [Methanoculleus sp.]HNQ32444.1 type I glyceraldehyde-3-phosphate dehydrogenase [Methanoculleus sp.]HNT07546.1 type I glyceraldehyde-3-phosphate dehydrogenase [Methanoculleus sp.]HOC84344.1 type I glyceraldehyde-3-phosphate dehydrogenase [Methanoculleus sp.]HOF97079.1 type I glyceraldehyde-3-phosphate dehydrogenase [Methanoculleus sp.]HOI61155.1 type I glyceraldehyde-3-phosphate dehydrogenase [Methanoculleus sp.]
MKKVAINGFGRIGRKVLSNYITDPPDNIAIVAVNDPNPTEELAYLMKYDSVHGRAPFSIEAGSDRLKLGSKEVRVLHDRDPARLPWGDLGVDLVLECTGHFTERAGSAKHIDAGAKRVAISAPSPDADLTVVLGVNESAYDPAKHTIISNASCTTNALAPAAKVLNDSFGVERLMATAIHAYTATQALVDRATKKPRRGRAAAVSLIPTTTGAAVATTRVLPELTGKMDAIAIRAPIPDGSVVDIAAELKRETTTDAVNAAMKQAADGKMKGYLAYTDDPLVSADIIGDPHSGVIDGRSTGVVDGRMARVLVWYDNEYGYAKRMVDIASYMASRE